MKKFLNKFKGGRKREREKAEEREEEKHRQERRQKREKEDHEEEKLFQERRQKRQEEEREEVEHEEKLRQKREGEERRQRRRQEHDEAEHDEEERQQKRRQIREEEEREEEEREEMRRQRRRQEPEVEREQESFQQPNRRDVSEDEDEFSSHPNLDFYQNKISSKPNGAKLEVILSKWYGNHDKMMQNPNFIQWLFPNRERGTNAQASPLTDEEIKAIKDDPSLKENVLRSFRMILDLYGMTLNASNKFKVIDNDPTFLKNFINHRPSHMWVSRILKALKELGHQKLMVPWLKFLAKLIFKEEILPAKFKVSFANYWIETLDMDDKMELREYCSSFADFEN